MPRTKSTNPDKPNGQPSGLPKTAAQWDSFFELVVRYGGNISRACEIAKVTRVAVYARRDSNEEFAARLARCVEQGSDVMMDEARRRAFEGVTEKVYWQGDPVDVKQTYSDALIQFMLRGLKPDVFKDRTENVNLTVEAGKFENLRERVADKLLKGGKK